MPRSSGATLAELIDPSDIHRLARLAPGCVARAAGDVDRMSTSCEGVVRLVSSFFHKVNYLQTCQLSCLVSRTPVRLIAHNVGDSARTDWNPDTQRTARRARRVPALACSRLARLTAPFGRRSTVRDAPCGRVSLPLAVRFAVLARSARSEPRFARHRPFRACGASLRSAPFRASGLPPALSALSVPAVQWLLGTRNRLKAGRSLGPGRRARLVCSPVYGARSLAPEGRSRRRERARAVVTGRSVPWKTAM